MLFADVAGSMDLQERLDAEVWAQIMGRFVSILAEGVRRFGGTVDKFTGDGIMALFGAPVAQEDHARRACHAAWHLTKAIGEYSEELSETHDVELQVRLGLNSGEVVVGRVGDDVTFDPTALGHTVGLAQRMEAMAEPGKAYLTQYTARMVEGWFSLVELGPRPIKGAREPLRVSVLGGPASSPPILRGGTALGAAPLVGRDRELAVLEDALVAAGEGRAQVVGVVGEAGVGKSRLCDEFAASTAAREIRVRRTAGVSHGRDVPLLPILSLLRDYFSITEMDGPDQAREKVAQRLLALEPTLEHELPLLFDFLEVPNGECPAPRLAAEVRMRRIFETLHRITARRSEKEVLVLVVEDLHWFDPQSAEFLERLVESFPGSRTLVVANFRPEFSAPWMRHSYYRQLPLAPLRNEAVGELLGGLLGKDLSLAPLLGFVLERTAGNPFFVEEVVRALVEEGTLAGGQGSYRLTRPLHEVKVPPNVQAVLAARIDRLPGQQKAVLQAAAVIGRSVPAVVLARVGKYPDLDEHIRALCAAEFLQEKTLAPAAEYQFWHPLTQEVAYGSLLSDVRASIHGEVARAIVELDPVRQDERAALIATHFERSGDNVETARWSARAAVWAWRSDLNESRRRWQTVLSCLSRAPETDETIRLAIRARARLLQLGARLGIDSDEVRRLYAEGKALAQALGDVRELASFTLLCGAVQAFRGDLRNGIDTWLEAASLSYQTSDLGLRANCSTSPPFGQRYMGPLGEALRLTDEGLALCQEDPDLGADITGYSPLSRTLFVRADLLARMGRLAEARREADRAVTLCRQRSDIEWAAWALSLYARLEHYAGEQADPARGKEAVRMAEESGNVTALVNALEGLGIAQLGGRLWPSAKNTLTRALEEARGTGVLLEEASVIAHLALAHLGLDDIEAARQAGHEAVAVARRQGARVLECLALLTRAQVLRTTGDAAAGTLVDLEDALALARETGALTYEPFIHEELGRLRGNEGELHEALRLYRQIGATGHARRLEADLSARVKP